MTATTPPADVLAAVRDRVDPVLHDLLAERRAAMAALDPEAAVLVDEIARLVAAGGNVAVALWAATRADGLDHVVSVVDVGALTGFVDPQLKLHMDYWESELGKAAYSAGDEFPAADIQMSFPLEAASARGGLAQSHPKATAFLARIHARPAYQRALEKGGPYEIGKA